MAIKVTDKAKNEVKELIKDSGLKNPAIRLQFNGFGWGGPRMGMVLDELSTDDSDVVNDNEINVVIDERLKSYVNIKNSLTIDFRVSRSGSGFVVFGGSSC